MGIINPNAGGTVIVDVIAPSATGIATVDTLLLKQAIAATPAGGTLLISGHYKINEAIERALSITIRGKSFNYSVGTEKSTPTSGPSEIAQLDGTMIEQTVAATDIIKFTGAAESFQLENCGLVFSTGLASTGEGINLTPAVEGAGHKPGVYGGKLINVCVGNHDGNHYALRRTNVCEFTTQDFRSFGGGGIIDVADSENFLTGNIVDIHPYIHLFSEGTAHGYARSSATSFPESHGGLNLCVSIRPQVNIDGAAATKGTQALWKDNLGAGLPARCLVIAPDLEAFAHANPVVFGTGTEVIGNNTNSQQRENLGIGFLSLGAADAALAKDNTAVGWEALAITTANSNTAVGALAGHAHTSGSLNAMLGYKALASNETGEKNSALGSRALETAKTSSGNTAVGNSAMILATGAQCTAVGNEIFAALTTGAENVGVGSKVAALIKTGKQNTFVGSESGLESGTALSNATALGYQTKVGGNFGTSIGYKAFANAIGAVAIGCDSGGAGATTAVENAIALGTANHTTTIAGSASVGGAGKSLGFYGKAPVARPAKPAETAKAIIEALESLGLVE